jgi:hypothetical protein
MTILETRRAMSKRTSGLVLILVGNIHGSLERILNRKDFKSKTQKYI